MSSGYQSNFLTIFGLFTHSSENEVDHCLAKKAFDVSNALYCMEVAPNFLLPPLQVDLIKFIGFSSQKKRKKKKKLPPS